MFKKALALVMLAVTFAMGLVSTAHAEVPAAVTAAITEGVTDIGVIGGAILVVVVAIAGFAWLRRPIR